VSGSNEKLDRAVVAAGEVFLRYGYVRTTMGDIAKAKRREALAGGFKTKTRNPMPGSKASGIRKRMDGTVEKRR
jgi:hypothetical protein